MRFFGTQAPYEEARIRLQGVPYEGTGNCRGGASAAPGAVREASQLLESYVPRLGKDLACQGVADLGDAYVEEFAELGSVMAEAVSQGVYTVWLGGDHGITEPAVGLMAGLYQDLAVVAFDAHLDAYEVYFGGERHGHATWSRRVGESLGRGRIWCLGARAYTRDEEEYFRYNQRLLPLAEIGLPEASRAARLEVGERPVYITLDIDVLDPAFAPGVGNPESLGATNRELWEALEVWKDAAVVGFDLVEVIPALDAGGRTAVVAAELVRDLILMWWGV